MPEDAGFPSLKLWGAEQTLSRASYDTELTTENTEHPGTSEFQINTTSFFSSEYVPCNLWSILMGKKMLHCLSEIPISPGTLHFYLLNMVTLITPISSKD